MNTFQLFSTWVFAYVMVSRDFLAFIPPELAASMVQDSSGSGPGFAVTAHYLSGSCAWP